jgi:hypothetical protein
MTAAASLSTLQTPVLLDCPQAPASAALDALRSAVREFLEKAEVLIEAITVTTVADTAAYALAVTTADMVAHRIYEVRYQDADGNLSDAPEAAATYYLRLSDSKLVFEDDYIPQDVYTYRVQLVLRPEWRAETVPLWILERWGREIAYGASAELMMRPGTPYANPDLGQFRRRQFVDGTIAARLERDRQGTRRHAGLGA